MTLELFDKMQPKVNDKTVIKTLLSLFEIGDSFYVSKCFLLSVRLLLLHHVCGQETGVIFPLVHGMI